MLLEFGSNLAAVAEDEIADDSKDPDTMGDAITVGVSSGGTSGNVGGTAVPKAGVRRGTSFQNCFG